MREHKSQDYLVMTTQALENAKATNQVFIQKAVFREETMLKAPTY